MPLSEEQKARIAANKKRALELKEEAEVERTRLEEKPKCEKCGSLEVHGQYMEAFMIAVCKECGQKDDNYALLNKGTAKEEYLLSDDTLNFLKHLTKNNPMKCGWAPMKLYLTKQVREASMKRWGDEEGLQKEKEKRAEQKSQRDLDKLRATAADLASGTVTAVAAAASSDPASTRGGFELGGDEASGAIFTKMLHGLDKGIFEPKDIGEEEEEGASPCNPRKKKQKTSFATYNQAVVEQQDASGMKLIAKADAKGGVGKSKPVGAGAKKPKGAGGNKALQAMINSIRGS